MPPPIRGERDALSPQRGTDGRTDDGTGAAPADVLVTRFWAKKVDEFNEFPDYIPCTSVIAVPRSEICSSVWRVWPGITVKFTTTVVPTFYVPV